MALSDLVSAGLQRPIAAIRRHAVSLAIAIVAAAGALIYAASALLMALELAFGPIGARLAVAGVMLAIAVGSYFAPRLFYRATPPSPVADPDIEELSRDQRIAMVVEALMLGFSMGSRKPAETSDAGK